MNRKLNRNSHVPAAARILGCGVWGCGGWRWRACAVINFTNPLKVGSSRGVRHIMHHSHPVLHSKTFSTVIGFICSTPPLSLQSAQLQSGIAAKPFGPPARTPALPSTPSFGGRSAERNCSLQLQPSTFRLQLQNLGCIAESRLQLQDGPLQP